ncbi:nuclease-related domain-containing protein [Salisediminibacterium halotolerans]|uniref:nuclease-related domain-containing protein n=1 Tax=Salisediminibacterium halotolerans TaxID=517425 RepID=UPI000EB3CDEE|nr:nuclease-related domain-containing protein [Salisediminibacterium halotolerans]RLJ78272.1 nuclease-like protein [Actinophytocola xinjiangensis]RPE88389.1 nuclease-like protein [Salisediminibacterium halotolerans]TWG37249.1 nuclease-like protein [Salisediminibacterium halotolerans]GEL07728.1 hypothetical protein SHA02_11440 [Salisediminibacterium halotolerans]
MVIISSSYHRPYSQELELLRILNRRSTLTEKQRNRLKQLEIGLAGEVFVDNKLKPYSEILTVIPDIIMQINHTHIQIDTLILSPTSIYLFEIKNYFGNYEITEDGYWLSPKHNYILNPLIQLERTQSLVRQLLAEAHVSVELLQGYVLFPDPSFTLYGAKQTMPIIFSSQLDSFFKQISSKLHNQFSQQKVIERIDYYRLVSSPFTKLPDINTMMIRPGVLCFFCFSPMTKSSQRTFKCTDCQKIESAQNALKRTYDEYTRIYQDHSTSLQSFHQYTDKQFSYSTIHRFLRNC